MATNTLKLPPRVELKLAAQAHLRKAKAYALRQEGRYQFKDPLLRRLAETLRVPIEGDLMENKKEFRGMSEGLLAALCFLIAADQHAQGVEL